MANEIETISANKKDIYQKLFDIAGNYTDLENSDYLKSGLFGYMTESMAMMIRDAAIQKSMLYKEGFLNTAIIPQSVYNWAKTFNIEVNKATPSYGTIQIRILKSSLAAAVSDYEASTNKYKITGTGVVIDKINQIIAGEYYFALEHSIFIKVDSNKYSAQYITTEEETTNFQSLTTTKLPVTFENVSGSDDITIIIEARAYQYKINKIERQLSSSNFKNKIQQFDFEDQFAGANLYYVSYGGKTKEKIDLLYSNINESITSGNKKAYYSLTSESQLEVNFKIGDSGFIPSANSRLIMYIYTTKGTNVPANYTSDALFRITDDNTALKRLSLIVRFSPTTIIGGKDIPTIDNIKQTVIKQISLCNTIVTESDLNNYFEILTRLMESVNDGKVTFVKKRDDILRRVFSSYILMRDGISDINDEKVSSEFISKCIPTNTIDIDFNDCSKLYYKYPRIELNHETNKYCFNNTPSNENDCYIAPFVMDISIAPIKKVRYYYTLVNQTVGCSVLDDTLLTGTDYFNPVSLNILRTMSQNEDSNINYTLLLKLDTNTSNNFFNGKTIKVSFLTENKTVIGTATQVTPSNYNTDDGYAKFILTIDVNDIGGKEIIDGKLKINSSTSIGDSTYVKIEIADANDSDIKLSIVTNDTMSLFKSLDDIMLSNVEVSSTTSEGITTINKITVVDVPVVHSSFLTNNTNQESFIEQLFTYIDLLKENLGKLETSTFFDLKFYNTYGPSQFYNTTTTNINLELVVHIKQDYASNKDGLVKEIRSYIRRAVDSSNSNGSLNISNIVALISKNETYGNYINYIEFKGLNGPYNQRISKLDTSEANSNKYPPEWLNIDSNKISNIEVTLD